MDGRTVLSILSVVLSILKTTTTTTTNNYYTHSTGKFLFVKRRPIRSRPESGIRMNPRPT